MSPKVVAPFLLLLAAVAVLHLPPAEAAKGLTPALAPGPAGKGLSLALAPGPAGKGLRPALAPGPAAPPANITKILSRYPEFSAFTAMLAETGLACAIASRPVVTVLALNNTAVTASIRRLPRPFLADLLSLHVVLDCLDPKRLDALVRGRAGNGSVVATMLQGTGARFLRVARGKDGRVTFSYAGPGGAGPRNATLVRVVTAQANTVLVLQVSGLVLPTAVPAINAAPFNITKILSRYPEFAVFNSLLIQTGLARVINAQKVVTVLAVNNTAIYHCLPGLRALPRKIVTDLLALHAVLDFLNPEKLDALRRGKTGNGSVVTTLLEGPGLIRVSGGADGRITFSSRGPGSPNARLVRVVTAQANTVLVLEVSGMVVLPGIIKPPSPAPMPSPQKPPASF